MGVPELRPHVLANCFRERVFRVVPGVSNLQAWLARTEPCTPEPRKPDLRPSRGRTCTLPAEIVTGLMSHSQTGSASARHLLSRVHGLALEGSIRSLVGSTR